MRRMTLTLVARALALYWLAFLLSWVLFCAGALIYLHAFGGDMETVANTATAGLRNFSIPVMTKVEAAGLPEFMGLLLVNGLATIVLFTLPASIFLFDPAARDRFPRRLRRFVLSDPTLVVLTPLPGFRRIPVPELKQLYAYLVVAPFVAPLLLGAIVGMISGVIVDPRDFARTSVLTAALILPHGILELSALFTAPACMHALYAGIRSEAEAGLTEQAWAALRPELRLRLWLPRLAFALLLVGVAAVIEAQVTEPFADALASLMGLDAS